MRCSCLTKAFVAVVFACLAMGSVRGADDEIVIGFGGALTGDVADYGISGFRGVQYAVERINNGGGIVGGKKVKIQAEDDACSPDMATNAATSLMSSGIKALVGHICSGATFSALGVYKNNVLLVSPSATAVALTNGQYPFFFRTIAPDNAQSRLQVAVVRKMGFSKVALIHDKSDYGKGMADMAKEDLEGKPGKAEIVLFEGVTPGQSSYDALVSKIKQSGADVVIWGGYHPEASKIISLMRRRNIKAAFIGPDGINMQSFLTTAGKNAEGVYATGPMDVSTNPITIDAIKWHKEKFQEDPGAFFINGVTATMALLNAIDKVGNNTDIDALKKALQSDYAETPLGKIKFNAMGDCDGARFLIYQVQNGQFVQQDINPDDY